MASTAAATMERIDQENYIIGLLQKTPGKKYSGKDLCESLNISQQRKRTLIDSLKPRYPQLQVHRGGNGGVYYWEGTDIPALENKKHEKVSINAERYSDPTAGAAITSADKEIEVASKLPKLGDVVRARHANGDKSLFFVLWSTETQATGIYINEAVVETQMPLFLRDVSFTHEDHKYYFNPKNVCAKPVRYLEETMFAVNQATIVQVRHRLADILGLQQKVVEKEKIVEKPVEKIVYKDRIVYKDKEKESVPDGYISRKDATIDDLMHQLAIYKDIVNRLAPLTK